MKTNGKLLAVDIAECSIFIVLMVAATFIQIPFPLAPLTFQTVIGVMAGLMLGPKKGVISMSVYCFMGLVGLPVFTAGGVITYVLKPTFGYILGFIVSAGVGGLIACKPNLPLWRYVVGALAAFLADYAIGIPYCIVAAKLIGGYDLTKLFIAGNLVFMPKDAVLSIFAAFLAKTILPVIRKGKSKLKTSKQSGINEQ